MRRQFLFAIVLTGAFIGLPQSVQPSFALEFPGTCITPSATVTTITGINTRNARMEGRYTLPDIVQACHQGYVDQANAPPDVCIDRHRNLTNSAPLFASADCVSGLVTVENLRTKLPAHKDCASGGIRAIIAFKALCPSYGGEIEAK